MTLTHRWGPDARWSFAKDRHHVRFYAGQDTTDAAELNCVGLLSFQDGPVAEHGVNGTTNEEVITVLLERIDALNQPPYDNVYNNTALIHLRAALAALEERTKERQARQVEGTVTP